MEIVLNDSKFKAILKEVVVELLQEKSPELIELISEALEDYAIGKAIQDGLKTETVSQEEVLKVLSA